MKNCCLNIKRTETVNSAQKKVRQVLRRNVSLFNLYSTLFGVLIYPTRFSTWMILTFGCSLEPADKADIIDFL